MTAPSSAPSGSVALQRKGHGRALATRDSGDRFHFAQQHEAQLIRVKRAELCDSTYQNPNDRHPQAERMAIDQKSTFFIFPSADAPIYFVLLFVLCSYNMLTLVRSAMRHS